MIKRVLRSILWVIAAVSLCAPPLHAQSPTGVVGLKTYTGFFNNTAVYFTALETSSPSFAAANNLLYAPRLGLAGAAGLANMLFFTNGSAGQTVVLQTEPGLPDYTPLWHVVTAFWRGPGAMPAITSYAAALQWWRSGQLVLQSTGILFNGPVVWVNMTLARQGGQLAPTLSPAEFAGINPAARAVFFRVHPGYYGGQLIPFLALEHAPGVISQAPGAIPVPTIDLNHLGHAAVDNFFVIPGQPPVLDSAPAGQYAGMTPGAPPVSVYATYPPLASPPPAAGAAGPGTSSLPVYSQPPYVGNYSPIWHVHQVIFRPGVQPVLLRSLQDIAAALSSGIAVQVDGGVQDTFDCPIPVVLQPGAVSPTPGGTGNPPGYVPPGTTTGGTTGATTAGSTTAGTTMGNPPGYVPPGTTTGSTTTGGTSTSGFTTGGTTTGGIPPVTTPPPAAVSFSRDILRIFTNNGAKTCAQIGCHGGPSPQLGQNLSAATAYSNIVNVPSVEMPSLLRVKPGDAAHSYLYMKITGAPGIVGSMMPLAGGPLSASDMQLILQWINEGAPEN